MHVGVGIGVPRWPPRLGVPGAGGGSSYDAASDLIFASFTTPPTTARKNLIDAAVVSLKSSGVWAKLDALYAFAAADSQAALINWKQPGTYNGTLVNAPAFAADQGFTGASTKYVDTSFNPTTAPSPKFTLNDASAFGWSLTNVDVAGGIIGAQTANIFGVLPRLSNVAYSTINSTLAYQSAANSDATGLFTGVRTSSAAGAFYRNTTTLTTAAVTGNGVPNEAIRILASFNGNWTGTCAAAGFGSQFSAADNTALYNALAAYMAGLATDRIAAAFTTPPTAGRKTLIQNCVTSLMTAGVWDKLDALYAFAAADAQAAKVNWKQPGVYNATEVNAPAFAADLGFTGASTKYLDSGFNPTTAPSPKFVQDSACFFAYANTNLNVVGGLLGSSSGANVLYPRHATDNFYIRVNNGGVNLTAASTSSIGFWSATRSASTASEAYKNAVSQDTDTAASIAVVNEATWFLRAGADYWTGQIAAGGFGSQLSAADNTALYNALRTYMTGVGVP